MQELKFKIWNKTKLKMQETANLIIKSASQVYTIQAEYLPSTGQEELTILKATGLLDKNGVEIFEGDICSGEFSIACMSSAILGYVLYKSESARFELISKDATIPLASVKELIIKGNQYENPQLIGVT